MTVLFIYIDLSLSFFDALVINQRGTKVFYCNFDCNLHAQQQYACFYKKKKKNEAPLTDIMPQLWFYWWIAYLLYITVVFSERLPQRGCHVAGYGRGSALIGKHQIIGIVFKCVTFWKLWVFKILSSLVFF